MKLIPQEKPSCPDDTARVNRIPIIQRNNDFLKTPSMASDPKKNIEMIVCVVAGVSNQYMIAWRRQFIQFFK